MIVLDSSAVLAALLGSRPARAALAEEQVHVPHLVDTEVAHVLRRLVLRSVLDAAAGAQALLTWELLGVTRHPSVGLLGRVWELRADLTAYDATYVALAEALGCALMTADGRLSRAAHVRCPVTVVPGS